MAGWESMNQDDINKSLSNYTGVGSAGNAVVKTPTKKKKTSTGFGMNVPSYTPSSYSVMSPEEAMAQAGSQLNPLAQLARQRVTQQFDEQRRRLPQYLNARGQAFGGARIIGEQRLSDDQSRQLSDIDLNTNSQLAALAGSLQEKSQDRAERLGQQDYSRWSDATRLALQKWQADLGQANADRSFNYGMSRDAVSDRQADRSFGLQQEQFGLQKGSLENDPQYRALQMAALQRQVNQPYSGGGSGGGTKANSGTPSTSSGEYTFNVDRGLATMNAIKSKKTTLADVDNELAQRYQYGQLTADEYNQWMYYLHPEQIGKQQASSPSYSGSALQMLLGNR